MLLFQDSDATDNEILTETQGSNTLLESENEFSQLQPSENVTHIPSLEQPEEQPSTSQQSQPSISQPDTSQPCVLKKMDHNKPKLTVSEEKQLFTTPKSQGYKRKCAYSSNSNKVDPITQDAFIMMKSVFDRGQNEQQRRDEYDIFGELVAHKIRCLNTHFAKATVQHQINNILYDAQVGKYDYPQYSICSENIINNPSCTSTSTPLSSPSCAPSPMQETEESIFFNKDGNGDILQWSIANALGGIGTTIEK